MAAIRLLLLLLVLCAPFGGAGAQSQSSTRLWQWYDPGQAQQMTPARTVQGIYQQVLQREDVQRLRATGSPGIRWVYESAANFQAALQQKYPRAFPANLDRPLVMAFFLDGIERTDEGRYGLWLPSEEDIIARRIIPPQQVVRPSVTRPVASAVPTAPATVTRQELEAVQEQVRLLREQINRLRSSSVAPDRVSTLERTLGQATAALGALTRAQEEQWRTAGERVGQLSAEVAAQHRELRAAVVQLEQQLAAEPRQITVERFFLPSWLGWVLGLIGLVAVGAFIVALRARRSARHGHERIGLVRKDLVAVKDDLGRRITDLELSPSFDTTLVSPEAIARLRTGERLSVPVTLSTGQIVIVTVTRRNPNFIAIGPLRRDPGGPLEELVFSHNTRVATVIARAGRDGRIGTVAESVVHQADAA